MGEPATDSLARRETRRPALCVLKRSGDDRSGDGRSGDGRALAVLPAPGGCARLTGVPEVGRGARGAAAGGNPLAPLAQAPSGTRCSPLGAQRGNGASPVQGALPPLRKRRLGAAGLPARSSSLLGAAGFSERHARRSGWNGCSAQDSLEYWQPISPKCRMGNLRYPCRSGFLRFTGGDRGGAPEPQCSFTLNRGRVFKNRRTYPDSSPLPLPCSPFYFCL